MGGSKQDRLMHLVKLLWKAVTDRTRAGWENLPLVDGQLQQRKRSAICYVSAAQDT